MTGLKKIDLPEIDITAAKQMAKAAVDATQNQQLGHAIVITQKP